jgi:chemotaxis response regulator CheB
MGMKDRTGKKQSERLSVLIAEDSADIRQILVNIFQRLPRFTVIGEAGNSTGAIQSVHNLKPDVLILDARVPKLSFPEVFREIQEDNCLVIIFTTLTGLFFRAYRRDINGERSFDQIGQFEDFIGLLKKI